MKSAIRLGHRPPKRRLGGRAQEREQPARKQPEAGQAVSRRADALRDADAVTAPAILVVDDDPTSCDLPPACSSGSSPTSGRGTAHTGRDTMRILEAESWDVVLWTTAYRHRRRRDPARRSPEARRRGAGTGEGDEALVADLAWGVRPDQRRRRPDGGAVSNRRYTARLERAIGDRSDALSEVREAGRQSTRSGRRRLAAGGKTNSPRWPTPWRPPGANVEPAATDYLTRVLDSAVDHFIIAPEPMGHSGDHHRRRVRVRAIGFRHSGRRTSES